MAAQFVSFGSVIIPVGGIPVRVVVPPTMNPPSCHALIIQTLRSNTGKIYIGLSGMQRTTLAQTLAVLPIPTDNLLPTFSIALTVAANAINVADLWLDADVNGEGVLISALVA